MEKLWIEVSEKDQQDKAYEIEQLAEAFGLEGHWMCKLGMSEADPSEWAYIVRGPFVNGKPKGARPEVYARMCSYLEDGLGVPPIKLTAVGVDPMATLRVEQTFNSYGLWVEVQELAV